MTEDISQRDALRLLLAVIAGNEPNGAFFELRYRHPGGGMRQAFQPVGRPTGIVDTVLHAGALTDVYVGAAPRAREAGRADAVERVWCVWADCDGDAAVETLESFRPRPSMIVRTGTGRNVHAWWALRHALTGEHARRANRRLAHHLGADLRSTDPARILRLPGSLNHKHAPPRPVVCERLELRTFDAREIVGGLADPPADGASATKASPAPPTSRTTDSLLAIPPTEYVPRLTGLAVPRDGFIRCPLPGHDDRTPSFKVWPDDRGVWCFGCERGGDIYSFAAALWKTTTKGVDFAALRDRLAAELGLILSEAA